MKHASTRKLVLTAMMACLAFVLNTFVYFPAMAPFQHFVDVVAAVFLGPWYACAAAFLCGVMRMMSGRTIQAIAGAVFGIIPKIGPILLGVWVLALLLPSLGVIARRLHDTGKSGWFQLVAIIPAIGVLVLLLVCIPEGSKEANAYGEPVVR